MAYMPDPVEEPEESGFANAVLVKVDDRAKKLRFCESLTTGSKYFITVEGGAETCGSDAALMLLDPAERQLAAAELVDGEGLLDLNTEEMERFASRIPVGTRLTLTAVLRCFDADAEQHVGVGVANIVVARGGTISPHTGTLVSYKGEPGENGTSFTFEDMTEAQKQEIAAYASGMLETERTEAVAAVAQAASAAQNAAQRAANDAVASVTRTGNEIMSSMSEILGTLIDVLSEVSDLPERFTDEMVRGKINEIISALQNKGVNA